MGYHLSFTVPAGKSQITLPPPGTTSVPYIMATITTSPVLQGGTGSIKNLQNGTYNFTLAAPPSNATKVTFDLKPQCSDPGKQVHVTNIPTSAVYYKADSGNDTWHNAGQPKWNFDKSTQVLSGGTLIVDGLVKGDSYTFKTAFDGKTYTKDVTITGTTMTESQTISGSYCK